MIEPPARTGPTRRTSVPAVVALASLIGAFLWGLAMYALGHGARADHAAGEHGHAAEVAMTQLLRVDQALAHEDAPGARLLLAQYTPPEGQAWSASAALREHAISRLEQQQLQRTAAVAAQSNLEKHLHLVSDAVAHVIDLAPCPGHDQLLLALIAHPQQGPSLLVSHDAGGHWLPEPVTAHVAEGMPIALVHDPRAPKVLVLGVAAARMAWSSADAAQFAVIHLPEHQGDLQSDGRCVVGGDGALVAVAASPASAVCCRSGDGGATWQAGMLRKSILALVPTAAGTLVIARSDLGAVTISLDAGASYQDADKEVASAVAGTAGDLLLPLAGRCLIIGPHELAACDDHGHLLSQARAWPFSRRPEAVVSHPRIESRWYALAGHAVWRSDDAGAHWRAGLGRLADLTCRCLAFTTGERPVLLLAGEGLWSFEDQDDGQLFESAPVH